MRWYNYKYIGNELQNAKICKKISKISMLVAHTHTESTIAHREEHFK